MEFLDKNLSDYAEMHTTAEREVLKNLNRETWSKVMMPRMLSGHLQGRFLSFISHMLRPKCILEIGTYTGYSAICLAEGLAENGVLHTIDVNEELEPMVKKYIKESGYETKIKTYFEPAVDVIPRITEAIDLVFIDADKENYALYFDLVIDKVRSGGIIAADNVLWSGKVLDEKALQKDKETIALDAYNKKVMQDTRVENILVPIRDGIMLALKL